MLGVGTGDCASVQPRGAGRSNSVGTKARACRPIVASIARHRRAGNAARDGAGPDEIASWNKIAGFIMIYCVE